MINRVGLVQNTTRPEGIPRKERWTLFIELMTLLRPRESQLCPECHADREKLTGMLKEPPEAVVEQGRQIILESENHAMARIIIENCPACQRYFVRLSAHDEVSQKATKGE